MERELAESKMTWRYNMARTDWKVFRLAGEQKRLQILLCDDDVGFLDRMEEALVSVCRKLDKQICVERFFSGENLTAETLRRCDLAFFDIDLESCNENGVEIARRMRQVGGKGLIFFVTNFIEYAPEGYEVQAFRYILKRDLDQMLERYMMEALEKLTESSEVLQLFWRGELVEISLKDILYLEVLQHQVSVVVQKSGTKDDGKTYTVGASLSEFEECLEPFGFLRVHKSYLVNMRHIRRFQCRGVELQNGICVAVSEKNYAKQKQKYLLWKGWQ